MTKLVNGIIPKGTECPFKVACGDYGKFHCKHTGVKHQVDFSCGIARAHDIVDERQEMKVDA